jgi:hypothetical protein
MNHPDVYREKVVCCRLDPNMPASSRKESQCQAEVVHPCRGAAKVASFLQYAHMFMTVQIQFVQVLVMDTWKIKKIKEIFYIKC